MLQPVQFAALTAIFWNPVGLALVVLGAVAGKKNQQMIVFSQPGNIIFQVSEYGFAGWFFACLIGQKNDVFFLKLYLLVKIRAISLASWAGLFSFGHLS